MAVLLTSGIRFKGFYRSVDSFRSYKYNCCGNYIFNDDAAQTGLINVALSTIGLPMVDWLGNPKLAPLLCCACRCMAGAWDSYSYLYGRNPSHSPGLFDAVKLDGGFWIKFRHVIIPLVRNSTFTVIMLSFIED